jgi:hypothetical protein
MNSTIEETPPGCQDLCTISVVPQVIEASIILVVVIATAAALLGMSLRKSGVLRRVR